MQTCHVITHPHASCLPVSFLKSKREEEKYLGLVLGLETFHRWGINVQAGGADVHPSCAIVVSPRIYGAVYSLTGGGETELVTLRPPTRENNDRTLACYERCGYFRHHSY